MSNSPKITEWIQSIAVTVGVGFGLWEFVLHDKTEEKFKKESVLRLITSGQYQEINKSYNNMLSGVLEFNSLDSIDSIRWTQFKINISPYAKYLNAWAFCYGNSLCDKTLTIEYICPKVSAYESLMSSLLKKASSDINVSTPNYDILVTECKKITKNSQDKI